MKLLPHVESLHNTNRPPAKFVPINLDTKWHHITETPAVMGESIEFKLHDETTLMGYRTEVACRGGQSRKHSFGVKVVYVAESNSDDRLFLPHQVVSWRYSKPFPKERFLGVCDSDEEEHLGPVSSLFVSYIYLSHNALLDSKSTNVELRFHQTRHFMDVDGNDYWQTFIDVRHGDNFHCVTMTECENDKHVTFTGPHISDRTYKFNEANEAVGYLLNSVL